MEDKEWNRKLLRAQLLSCKRNYRKTKNNIFLNDIEALEALLDDKILVFETDNNFKQKLEDDINIANCYMDYYTAIQRFYIDSAFIKIFPRITYDRLDNSIQILTEFLSDFYNKIGGVWAKYFNDTFRHRKDNLAFGKERSWSIFAPSIDYCYIYSGNDGSIMDYFNLVHEYAHAVSDRMNGLPRCYENNILLETIPLTFELIAADEIVDFFEGLDEEVIKYNIVNCATIILSARRVVKFTNYIGHAKKILPFIPTMLDMMFYTKSSLKCAKKILQEAHIERLIYTLSFLVAIELYYFYKSDPEKALNIMEAINQLYTPDGIIQTLEDNNIMINEHSEAFVNDSFESYYIKKLIPFDI